MKNFVELRKISDQYLEELAKNPNMNALDLKAYVRAIATRQAEKSHQAWCQKKREAGYVYGESVDDEKKTTNLLVDFEDLPEEYKQANIDNATAAAELMMSMGVMVGRVVSDADKESMILNMAKALHDKWVLTKMNQGYRFGEKRNDDAEKGEKTHRDMLPFEVLQEVYPEDIAYDCDTARGVIDDLMASGMTLVRVA